MDDRGRFDDGIVHFRVVSIVPNPLRQGSDFDAFMLNIAYVNHPAGTTFSLSSVCYARRQQAIDNAIASQLVYWVDWSRAIGSADGFATDRSELDLLLEAVADNQFVIDPSLQTVGDVRRDSLIV